MATLVKINANLPHKIDVYHQHTYNFLTNSKKIALFHLIKFLSTLCNNKTRCYMKTIFKTCLLSTLIGTAISNANAANANDVSYSPYADLTLQVHWDPEIQSLEPINLSDVSKDSGVQSYHLAFITDSGSCAPAWGGQSSYAVRDAWGSKTIAKLRANQISYRIALGGANGNDISRACTDAQLVDAYQTIIKTYQPEGLDFDIENGTADVAKVMRSLQQVQRNNPNIKLSFTLPVMPEGLTATGEDIVKQAKAANLQFTVNIMAMDYGPAYPNDMGAYAIQAAQSLSRFLTTLYPDKSPAQIWQMIEVTPMIGVNDVSVEQFTLANAHDLYLFAKQNQLAGLAMWAINRDKPCPDKTTNTFCSGNNLQSVPYEFSAKFLGK